LKPHRSISAQTKAGIKRPQSRKIVSLSAAQYGKAQQPIEVSNSGPSDLAFTPISAGFSAAQMRDPLRARLAASNAVFRYQPQIDLLTGRVAGVEALLCVPGLREYRPAVELAAEIEAAGLGMALVERRLCDACRSMQRRSPVCRYDRICANLPKRATGLLGLTRAPLSGVCCRTERAD
jgi:hypothetical protein